jgi:tetratricopeptide (TPR) repeat protein
MKTLSLMAALLCAACISAHADDGATPNPADSEPLRTLADAAFQAQDWPRLEDLAKQYLALHPHDYRSAMYAGQAEFYMGRLDSAFGSLDTARRDALAIQDPPPELRAIIGIIYSIEASIRARQQRTDDAVVLYKASLTYGGVDPAQTWMSIATTQFRGHYYSDAIASSEKVIALDPRIPDPYFLKGMILVTQSPIGADGKHVTRNGRQALEIYLRLAPNGDQAALATEALTRVSRSSLPPGAATLGP